jgi:tetratricopeptide (TPR) repeat protein
MARRGRNQATMAKIGVAIVLAIIAFVGWQYGSLLQAMNEATVQYSQGDTETALARYEMVERKLRSYGAMRLIPARDRQNLFLNQARMLYALGRYDDALDRLEKENEISGVTTDGRFFLLRGEVGFRKAIDTYQHSEKKDLNLLEENLLGAEDSLREALRLSPDDWDAKYNYEFVNYVRQMLLKNDSESEIQILEEVKPQQKELPPELAG